LSFFPLRDWARGWPARSPTQPKQFLALDGVPILIHSLRAFAAAPRVTAIYVAVRKPEMERVEAQVAEYGFAGRVHVVEGGEKRQESVAHALAALPAEPTTLCWSTTRCAR
jgi:2-C-methyl-D-erythritol 4-phosphate cytidylyltransferase